MPDHRVSLEFMLETSILHIKNSKLYNCSDSWKHRVSGNVVELSVDAGEISDRSRYRCSVITIGQVIKALSERIEADGSQYHIQSFPSLENPEIIASIRKGSNGFSPKNPYFFKTDHKKKILPVELLDILAAKYQFKLDSISVTTLPADIGLEPDKRFYSLSSVFDNPFIWLNLGYMKETFIRTRFTGKVKPAVIFNDLCAMNETEKSDFNLPENLRLQAIAGF